MRGVLMAAKRQQWTFTPDDAYEGGTILRLRRSRLQAFVSLSTRDLDETLGERPPLCVLDVGGSRAQLLIRVEKWAISASVSTFISLCSIRGGSTSSSGFAVNSRQRRAGAGRMPSAELFRRPLLTAQGVTGGAPVSFACYLLSRPRNITESRALS